MGFGTSGRRRAATVATGCGSNTHILCSDGDLTLIA